MKKDIINLRHLSILSFITMFIFSFVLAEKVFDDFIQKIIFFDPTLGADAIILTLVPFCSLCSYLVASTPSDNYKVEMLSFKTKGHLFDVAYSRKIILIPIIITFLSLIALMTPDIEVPHKVDVETFLIPMLKSDTFLLLILFSINYQLTVLLEKPIVRPKVDLIFLMVVNLIIPFIAIGLFFSGLYLLLSISSIEAFNIDFNSMTEAIYFSFVVLTTLGFGDILPQNELARIIVTFESVIGVFYMGVALTIILAKVIEEQKIVPSVVSPRNSDESNYKNYIT